MRCGPSEKGPPSFGHKICHWTTLGNPTDITAKLRQLFHDHVNRMHPPFFENTVAIEHGRRDPLCPLCHTPMMPKKKERRVVLEWLELSFHDDSSCATASQDVAIEKSKPRPSTRRFGRKDVVTFWSSPGPMALEREPRATCVEPSSTTRARSQGANRSNGD